MTNENIEEFREMQAEFVKAISPQDPIEWVWLLEYVNRQWEVMRLLRWEASVMKAASLKGLTWAMNLGALDPQADNMCERDLDPEIVRFYRELRVNRKDPSKVDPDLLGAECFLARREALESIHRRIVSAERRRNAALREIERRRERMAKQLAETSRRLMDDARAEVRNGVSLMPKKGSNGHSNRQIPIPAANGH